MVLSPEAQAAFDIGKESDQLRDEYGRTEFGQSLLMARRLVESGVRFVTVNYGGWDHHEKIFQSLDKKLPEFDQSFARFICDMDERGTLKETLIACFGEFGRTPKVNKKAGRDHWGRGGVDALRRCRCRWRQGDRSNRQERRICDRSSRCGPRMSPGRSTTRSASTRIVT
jgi:hypothetical protein